MCIYLKLDSYLEGILSSIGQYLHTCSLSLLKGILSLRANPQNDLQILLIHLNVGHECRTHLPSVSREFPATTPPLLPTKSSWGYDNLGRGLSWLARKSAFRLIIKTHYLTKCMFLRNIVILANELISKIDYEKVRLTVSRKDQNPWDAKAVSSGHKS